ncbi:MAG TPA: glycosyltransferase family 39 protein [Bryobacteraceae bacterium]|nr:glycosyltransferase family 39 protein [Bryobacteraceae bacterium]
MAGRKADTAQSISRWEVAAYAALVLLTIPARLLLMRSSLWLDEAWVANSVQSPSLGEMFRYSHWVQSTPPLFLIVTRWAAQAAGPSEAVLRILPTVAALASLIVIAAAYRRVCGRLAALAGTAILAANYWGVKYGGQVKQYGTDLLVASLLVLLVTRRMTRPEWPGRQGILILAGTFVIAAFAAFPAFFFLPSVLVALALRAGARDGIRRRGYRSAAVALGLVLPCAAVEYWEFIRPNTTPEQVASLTEDFLSLHHLGRSLAGLWSSFSQLLVPLHSGRAAWIGGVLLVLALGGILEGARRVRRREAGGSAILTAGGLPIAMAVAASFARQYPVLEYARLLMWALPCIGLLIAAGLDPVFAALSAGVPKREQALRAVTVAASIFAVLASQMVLIRYPRPNERNREAVQFLRRNMEPADCLFVHGGSSEQFYYYRGLLGWSPECVYLGNTDWPCCPRGIAERASTPLAANFSQDLGRAADRARRARLWLLLPSGEEGHWSGKIRPELERLPVTLSRSGCLVERKELFDETMVVEARCDSGETLAALREAKAAGHKQN